MPPQGLGLLLGRLRPGLGPRRLLLEGPRCADGGPQLGRLGRGPKGAGTLPEAGGTLQEQGGQVAPVGPSGRMLVRPAGRQERRIATLPLLQSLSAGTPALLLRPRLGQTP